MTHTTLEFGTLISLLRRPSTDVDVEALTGGSARIKRSAHVGSVARKADGISIMFKQASSLVPPVSTNDPRELYVSAFHLHRQGHEGYAAYVGAMVGGVAFDDPEATVLRKLGEPAARGGGGVVEGLNLPVPHWIQYGTGAATVHIQLDGNGHVEMVTLQPRREAVKDQARDW